MYKNPAGKTKKTKTPTKSGVKVIATLNKGFYGEEPIYDRALTTPEFDDAMNWYNYNLDEKDGFGFLIQWLTQDNREDLAKQVKSTGYKYFYLGLGSMARMLLNGSTLPDYAYTNFEKAIQDGLAKGTLDKSIEAPTVYKEIPQLNEKNVDLLVPIFDAIDALDMTFDLRVYLAEKQVPKDKAVKIGRFLMEEYEGDLDQIEINEYLQMVFDEIKEFAGVDTLETPKETTVKAKKPRKPRKKKIIPPEKKVAKVKIALEDKDLGLKSIEPKEIIGKSSLWIYDSRYGKLTSLKAKEGGLDVKGSTVINVDEDNSESKRVGRKAKEITQNVVKGGKVDLRNMFKTIKTANIKFTGRLSANTVLLRVEK